ncbi:MAG: hypothetical protein CMJ62_14240 [Planctomycetaceae bacterium]|nr:hypothetical protein [Planctomycetaceae bacterium]
MTYGFNNHAVKTQRWRYIRYNDGGQELYDHSKDQNEWSNLARSPVYEEVITKLKTALPEINRK